MVSPGFLENPEVRLWLNGVEPAWTMLDFDSFNALHDEPSASNPAIRLEPNPDCDRNLGICGHDQCVTPASTSSRDRWTEADGTVNLAGLAALAPTRRGE
jgi:hypothetical protein